MSIELLDTSPIIHTSNSLVITYPKQAHITFGNYPYPDQIENLKIEIKNNLKEDMEQATYVRGKMTDWDYFINNPLTTKFLNYCINEHQLTNQVLFRYFYDRQVVLNMWGNELSKGNRIDQHQHPFFHGILYLTKGNPLMLPQLGIKITPKPGDYYFFPPGIEHHMDEVTDDTKRYSIVMNIVPNTSKERWEKNKRLRDKYNDVTW